MGTNNQIVVYQTADNQTQVDVHMENETVWLTQAQMAELFQKDRTVISRHIRNVFNEGELEEQSTCAKFAHMGHDGLQQYETVMYNLDVTDLAYWHLAEGVTLGADGAYTCSAEPGEFHVWIAPNAAEGTPAKFILQD